MKDSYPFLKLISVERWRGRHKQTERARKTDIQRGRRTDRHKEKDRHTSGYRDKGEKERREADTEWIKRKRQI